MCSGTCGTCHQCQDTCYCTPIPYVESSIEKIDASGVIYNMDTNCSTSKLMCFFGIRNGTNLKTILEKLDEKLCQVRGLFDEKVKVSIDDTSEGYLFDKIQTHSCITKSIVTDGFGNQKLLLGVDCNCIKDCINNTPQTCFLPIYGNPLRICNGATTTVQINTINTGINIVEFSTNEGLTWVNGTPNNYTFTFPSDGSLQKIKARLKGCNEYADGFVSLCTVSVPYPVSPPVSPIAPTPVAPTPTVPVAPTVPVSPTPVFVPVTPPAPTPVTPIAPTPVPVSPTPVAPPVGCISISNFDYTINGNSNINGFTITGVQDINIAVTGYTPSGANTPIFYEYILDGFSSGIISNNTKNFPSVNIGNHVLSIITYNCTGSITKNINFSISEVVVPVAPPVVPPVAPPVAPTAPTCNQISNLQIVGDTTVDANSTGVFTLSFSGVDNITAYNWAITGDGASLISINNTNTATFEFGSGNGVIFLQVLSCGVNIGTAVNYSINSTPVAPTPTPTPVAPPVSPTPVPVPVTPVSPPVTPITPTAPPTTPVAPTPVAPTPVSPPVTPPTPPPTPVLSVCRVSSQMEFTAAGFGTATSVVLYETPSNTVVGSMIISGAIATYVIESFVLNQEYYCIASNLEGASGASNIVITNLGSPTC